MAKVHAQYLEDNMAIAARKAAEFAYAISQPMHWEAEQLRDNKYVVRPRGQLGTCGFYPRPWTAQFVNAHSCADAMVKFNRRNLGR